MIRALLALAAAALLAAPAEAGRRCRRTYQTLYSTAGWSHGSGCYSCHARKSQARDPKELLSGLASKLSGDAAWYKEFNALTSGYTQRGGYAQQGYGGYQTTVNGEYSSYSPAGNSLYGVQQAYSNHPLLDLNAAAGTLGKVVEQTNAGAQGLIAGYGNFTASAYASENDRQARIAAYQAILGVHQGPAVAAKAEVFRYQSTTEPAAPGGGQPSAGNGQNAPQQPAPPHPGLVVLNNRCVACHSPQGEFGVHGKFDLSKLDLAMVQAAADRVSLPPGDAKAMPQVKTAEGFGPGETLPWNEIRAVQDLALGVAPR